VIGRLTGEANVYRRQERPLDRTNRKTIESQSQENAPDASSRVERIKTGEDDRAISNFSGILQPFCVTALQRIVERCSICI